MTLLQFAERLPDRQVADAVRRRIDWKYLLGLELTDPGFDASVLTEFRARLVDHEAASRQFDRLLEQFQSAGLLKAGGRQRTDSTPVLGAIRAINRLALVGETMRAALNALAVVEPQWLSSVSPPHWFERYGPHFEHEACQKAKPNNKCRQNRSASMATTCCKRFTLRMPRVLSENTGRGNLAPGLDTKLFASG